MCEGHVSGKDQVKQGAASAKGKPMPIAEEPSQGILCLERSWGMGDQGLGLGGEEAAMEWRIYSPADLQLPKG